MKAQHMMILAVLALVVIAGAAVGNWLKGHQPPSQPPVRPPIPPPGPQPVNTQTLVGKISSFGGPEDLGVGPGETLSLYPDSLARGLPGSLPEAIAIDYYCAMRWDYASIQANLGTDRDGALTWLRGQQITVQYLGRQINCIPVDWGPAHSTGRLIDCGPAVLTELGCETDDTVAVVMSDQIVLK